MAIGVYPNVSLAEAREKRERARKQLANGVDPSASKKAAKIAIKTVAEKNFEYVAREWHMKNCPLWSLKHRDLVLSRLSLYIFPLIGSRSIDEISPSQLLDALRPIELKGALETDLYPISRTSFSMQQEPIKGNI